MAESDIKGIDIQKDVHNNKNTEEQIEEVKLDRKTEDTKETNNDSTISLKSFKMMDDKHREDQSKNDNDVKTNRNQNNSEDIQEEVSAPKCCNCIYEVSEFLPWFCINIGRWCSNSFKRNCCFCCNKKIVERKRGAFDEEDEEYWDGNVINEGDLTRYSLPVCVDDDGNEDDSIKIKFHRNEGFDEGDDIKIENVDFEKCDNVDKGDIDMNKGSDHDIKTVKHDDNHRSNSHGLSDLQIIFSNDNITHDHYNDLNKCDNENKKDSGINKINDYDTKTVIHDNNHHRYSHRNSDVHKSSHGVSSHDHDNDLNKCDNEIKAVSGWSKEIDYDTKTVIHDYNNHRYSHSQSDVHKSSHGVSSRDHCNDFNKYDNVNIGDVHMSKGSDHDTQTVTHDDNHHSYGHGHSDVHSGSHGVNSDSHVSHDYSSHSYTDTGYSGGDVGGCDTGGSDW